MFERGIRPLSLPVGVASAAILALTVPMVFAEYFLPGREGRALLAVQWARGLMLLAVPAVAAGAALFYRRDQAWPGRLLVLAGELQLAAALIFLPACGTEGLAWLLPVGAADRKSVV